LLEENGFTVSKPQKNKYSYNQVIKGIKEDIVLAVYFGKKGNKIVLQGNKESDTYTKVNNLIFGKKLFDEVEDLSKRKDEFQYKNYIGTDESGKGDYFGPLVIAGVYVNPDITEKLKKLGVRDSKTLSDRAIKDLSREIKQVCEQGFSTIMITPEKYNELHKKMGNVNRILGWAHAKVLENVLEICDVQTAISDKFGNEKLILNALQEKGRNLYLYQTTKAERYTAVAAASILARDVVVRWFESNSNTIGFILPKGASSAVEAAAKKILSKFGSEYLNKIAKVHFKTSPRLTGL
jgi:ribonuclease HIII